MQSIILNMAQEIMKLKHVTIFNASPKQNADGVGTTNFILDNLKGVRNLAYPGCSAENYNSLDFQHLEISPYTIDDSLVWAVPLIPSKPYWKCMLEIFQPNLWFACVALLILMPCIYWPALRVSVKFEWIEYFIFFFRTNLGEFACFQLLGLTF